MTIANPAITVLRRLLDGLLLRTRRGVAGGPRAWAGRPADSATRRSSSRGRPWRPTHPDGRRGDPRTSARRPTSPSVTSSACAAARNAPSSPIASSAWPIATAVLWLETQGDANADPGSVADAGRRRHRAGRGRDPVRRLPADPVFERRAASCSCISIGLVLLLLGVMLEPLVDPSAVPVAPSRRDAGPRLGRSAARRARRSPGTNAPPSRRSSEPRASGAPVRLLGAD